MRTTHDILRVVVEAGWYGKPTVNFNSEFMCRALERAVVDEVITQAECNAAKATIAEYMGSLGDGDSSIMSWALYNAGLIEEGAAWLWATVLGKEFYSNWDNRPGVPV